jgi:thymidylate synthase (FAD)
MRVELKHENSTSNPVETCLQSARGDYMSDSLVGTSFEEAMEGTEKNKRELVRDLLRKGHFGPLEHATAYFAVEGVSRVTMAQITRHRHLSFDVQSMRYVNFEDAEPVVPESFEESDTTLRTYFTDPVRCNHESQLERHWEQSIELYQDAVDDGVPKEDARFFLPLAAKVNLSFSGNIRTLLHVLDLRHSGKAQWEVRELAEKIIEAMEEWCPIVVEEWREHTKNASLQSP